MTDRTTATIQRSTATGEYGASTLAPVGTRPLPGQQRTRGSLGPAQRILLGALLPAIVLGAWWLSTSTGFFAPHQLPSPAAVVQAGAEYAERGLLGVYVAISTQRVLIGFAIGAVLGLAIGALVGLSRFSDALFSPLLGGVRAVPSLAWVPLLLLWMGIGEEPKIVLIAIGAFFPVYTTVAAALRHVDRDLVEAGRAFGYRGVALFFTVQLPAVVPSVAAGLRLALAQSWLFLVAAELLASSMGLGYVLTDSQQTGRVDRIILAIVLLAILGKLSDAVFGLAERWAVKRWA